MCAPLWPLGRDFRQFQRIVHFKLLSEGTIEVSTNSFEPFWLQVKSPNSLGHTVHSAVRMTGGYSQNLIVDSNCNEHLLFGKSFNSDLFCYNFSNGTRSV